MTSRTKSQSWIALSLAAVLSALVIEPVAHEPRLTAQVAQDSRGGLLVARRGLVSGAGEVVGVVVKMGRVFSRVQWGGRK